LAPALLSFSDSKTRKYKHTLEAIQPGPGDVWVGVHSAAANKMVSSLLESGILKGEVRGKEDEELGLKCSALWFV
jgi:DNA-binding sugar fermentation-stimulating protein